MRKPADGSQTTDPDSKPVIVGSNPTGPATTPIRLQKSTSVGNYHSLLGCPLVRRTGLADLCFIETSEGILLKPITSVEDLAGIDAGKMSLQEVGKKADDIRAC